MESKVRRALEEIRPAIQTDGGDVELVSVDARTGVVSVRFLGACVGCPLLSVTLQQGVERKLREHVPQIAKVEVVT